MESSDTLVKRLMSEIREHSKYHQNNRTVEEAVREIDIYGGSNREPFILQQSRIADTFSPSKHQQQQAITLKNGHPIDLAPSYNQPSNNNGESELSCYSSINSSLIASVLKSNKSNSPEKCDYSNNLTNRYKTEPKNYRKDCKQPNSEPSSAMNKFYIHPHQSSTPLMNTSDGGEENGHSVCPTCGAKSGEGRRNNNSVAINMEKRKNGKAKATSPDHLPPPLPDPTRKYQRLASHNNKDDMSFNQRTPCDAGLYRCSSVPSLLCGCAVRFDDNKCAQFRGNKCFRCHPGSKGSPCRYHKRETSGHENWKMNLHSSPQIIKNRDNHDSRRRYDEPFHHHHHHHHHDSGVWLPDCQECIKIDGNTINGKGMSNNINSVSKDVQFNMDKHLAYYSALPELWNTEAWSRRRRKESHKSRERLLIVGVSIVSMIVFLTLTYYGVIVFQRVTDFSKTNHGRRL